MSIATLQYRLHHDLLHTLLSLKVELTLLDTTLSRTPLVGGAIEIRFLAGLSRCAFYAIDVRSPRSPLTPRLRTRARHHSFAYAMRAAMWPCDALAWLGHRRTTYSAVRPPRSAHHHWPPSPSAAKLSKLRREATPSADSCGGTAEETARSPVSSPLCTCCPMADAGCGGGDSCGGRKGSSGGCSISPLCMFCRFGAGEMGDAGSAGAARASSRASASGAGCG